MGTKIYGIGACEAPDHSGETLKINGLDVSRLRGVRDEHDDNTLMRMVGGVTFSKKIMTLEECDTEQQKRCWDFAQVPFLYAEGELADSEGHPDAQAAAALLKFTSRPNIPLKLGFSVDGGTLKRGGPDNKTLERTCATSLALTSQPCNPKCRVFLFNDLQKSDLMVAPPASYWKALKKQRDSHAFNEDPLFRTYLMAERLKKSLDDYLGGFTSLKCWTCGNGIRFFKSSKNVPAACPNCGHSFSIQDVWRALNQ